MRLRLTEDHARALVAHAQQAYPAEACGLIGGVGDMATQIIPIPNVSSDPQRQFRLDERVFIETVYYLQQQSAEIIGIYHSHPHGDPLPSSTDLQEAAYPDIAYLIIGLSGTHPRLGAWSLRQGRAVPVELHIGLRSTAAPDGSAAVARPQHVAILVAAVLAFACMVLWSLALLPPAPVILTPVP